MSGTTPLLFLFATLGDAHSQGLCLPGIVKMRILSKEFVRLHTLKLRINVASTMF
jgi:hypothetical protein